MEIDRKVPPESEHLLFREITEEDLADLHKLDSDPYVMRFIGDGQARSFEETSRRLKACMNYYKDHSGFGIWVTVLKSSRLFIGWSALKRLGDTQEIEVGYRYMKQFWGNGFATEATLALLQYGFMQLDLQEVVAVTHPENLASQRVLEKAGLSYLGFSKAYDTRVKKYSITRQGWNNLPRD